MCSKAFALSQEGPCVWFWDEIESFATGKGESLSISFTVYEKYVLLLGTVEGRISTQLASILDKIHQVQHGKLVVVAATNNPGLLDKIIRRRMDKEVGRGH
jgi:SpoVK/Ycf46/Vps4 family AAA+-type ATPase